MARDALRSFGLRAETTIPLVTSGRRPTAATINRPALFEKQASAQLPYVDPDQIYLGGHSTGGTMVMLVAECSDRYRAVFSLGPVAIASQYGGDFIYCDLRDPREIALRSPLPWLHCVQSPLYVFEGASQGNWDAIQLMVDANTNPQIHFFKIAGHDHFTIIAPLAEKLANQIVQGQIHISEQTLKEVF